MGTGSAGGRPRRKLLTSYGPTVIAVFSPVIACLRNSTVWRIRVRGSSSFTPFQTSTIAGELVPMPRTMRPGARSASPAAVCARSVGVRV